MNKKGFSLTELLGVLIILAIIGTLAVLVFDNIRKSTIEKNMEDKINNILTASKMYGDDYIKTLTTSEFDITVTVQMLLDENYLESTDTCNGDVCFKNDITNDSMNDAEIKLNFCSGSKDVCATFVETPRSTF